MGNQTRAVLLLATPCFVLIALGALLGPIGLAVAMLLVIGLGATAYFCGNQILLRTSKAQPLSRDRYPGLCVIAKELTEKVGMRTPELYWISAAYPIAFATGRSQNHAAIVLSEGLIQRLNLRELRAVMAYQIAHIHQRNVWLATVAALFVMFVRKFTQRLSRFRLFYSSPVDQPYNPLALPDSVRAAVSSCIKLLVGPGSGRYRTDSLAAEISEDPFALANALRKLAKASAEAPADYFDVAACLSIVGSQHVESTHPSLKSYRKAINQNAVPNLSGYTSDDRTPGSRN